MLYSGLVSITFRKLAPAEIIALVQQAGLLGIEWGGDVHVPHGDIECARAVRRMTEDAGLAVAAYGSYYRVGQSEQDGLAFERVLETAEALGAPLIRVWAGTKGAAEADSEYRRIVVDESRRISQMAAEVGVTVAYEFHGGTLTDTAASARDLLESVAHPNLKTLWQPLRLGSAETEDNSDIVQANLADLREVSPWLANVHVYHWVHGASGRQIWPLTEGQRDWTEYLKAVASLGGERYLLLEFTRGDAPEAFREDAATLNRWLQT